MSVPSRVTAALIATALGVAAWLTMHGSDEVPIAGAPSATTPGNPVDRSPEPRAADAGPATSRDAVEGPRQPRIERVRGRVLDAFGRPLGDARVSVEERGGGTRSTLRGDAVSGTDGRFSIHGAALRPGPVVIRIHAPDHAPFAIPQDAPTDGAVLDTGDLQLSQGGTLIGAVEGPDGAAVPNASVTIRIIEARAPGLGRRLADLPGPVSTGVDGTFRAPHLPAGLFGLEAKAPGKVRGAWQAPIAIAGDETVDAGTLRLAAASRVRGEVVDPGGEPVADAKVEVRTLATPVPFRARAVTDQDGRFAVDHVPRTSIAVEVTARGYVGWQREPVDASDDVDLVVHLGAGLVIRGQVVAAESGRPIEAFAVRALQIGDARTSEASALEPDAPHPPARYDAGGPPRRIPTRLEVFEAHPRGEFELGGLDAGVYAVEVRASGRVFVRSEPIRLRPDDGPAHTVVRLARGIRVAGRVLAAPHGRLVAGATVALALTPGTGLENPLANRARPGPPIASTVTDSAGTFAFDGIEPHRYAVVARHEDFAELLAGPFEIVAERTDLELTLLPPAQLSGTVRNLPPDQRQAAQVVAYGGPGRLSFTAVGADGSYRFERLHPGRYVVRAFVGGAHRFVRERPELFGEQDPARLPADVEVAHGQRRRLDLTPTPCSRGDLSGVVRENGTTVTGARVRAGAWSETRTDGDGRFTIPDVTAGEVLVEVRLPGADAAVWRRRSQLAAGSREHLEVEILTGGLRGQVAVEPPPEGAIVGTAVLLPGATAVPDNLAAHLHAGGLMMTIPVRDGRFDAEHLPSGSALLLIHVAGRPAESVQVEVPTGAVREVTVVVRE